MAEIRLLEIYNPYPQALLMDLEICPLAEGYRLELSLSAQEEKVSLLEGSLKFGLKTGRMSLEIQGGEFQPQETDVFPQISAPGPGWLYPLPPDLTLWKGGSRRCSLGFLAPVSLPMLAVASFRVNLEELSILDGDHLWRPDLSPNQLGVIERLLARFLWRYSLPNPLSGLQVAVGDLPAWEDRFSCPLLTPSAEALTELRESIEAVSQSPQTDLPTLAVLGKLDYQRDCAGGRFLGADLPGIEWQGSILRHGNFRGALLTDADLSGADLRYSVLSGADLSGAYLEGANLRGANCHKSSLALANLIGADLRGANLVGAALQQANLSGALVEGARLGDNAGLTPAMVENLQERGAVWTAES
ncbi:MAG: pentapeptide repeat-containing protein [Cyanobacteriota bacterium]|jgi:hypothetical protein